MDGLQGLFLLWHLLVQSPNINIDAPFHVPGTVLGTSDTPSEQDREGSSLVGLTAWYLPLQLPEEGGPSGGHSGGGWTTGHWLRLRDTCPFLPVILRACSEWEQMPGTDDVTLCTVRAVPGWLLEPCVLGETRSVSGYFSPVGMAVPRCPSDSETLALGT